MISIVQRTCDLAAFEIVALETRIRSVTARSQFPSSKWLKTDGVSKSIDSIQPIHLKPIQLLSVCNWMGSSLKWHHVCDNTAIIYKKQAKIANLFPSVANLLTSIYQNQNQNTPLIPREIMFHFLFTQKLTTYTYSPSIKSEIWIRNS